MKVTYGWNGTEQYVRITKSNGQSKEFTAENFRKYIWEGIEDVLEFVLPYGEFNFDHSEE